MAIVVGAVDKTKVSGGSWFSLDDQRFLIARHDSPRYQEALEYFMAPHRRALEKKTLPASEVIAITCRAMARGLLLGWEGVVDVEGNAVSYSEDAGFQVLVDSPDFREFVASSARDESAFFKDAARV